MNKTEKALAQGEGKWGVKEAGGELEANKHEKERKISSRIAAGRGREARWPTHRGESDSLCILKEKRGLGIQSRRPDGPGGRGGGGGPGGGGAPRLVAAPPSQEAEGHRCLTPKHRRKRSLAQERNTILNSKSVAAHRGGPPPCWHSLGPLGPLRSRRQNRRPRFRHVAQTLCVCLFNCDSLLLVMSLSCVACSMTEQLLNVTFSSTLK